MQPHIKDAIDFRACRIKRLLFVTHFESHWRRGLLDLVFLLGRIAVLRRCGLLLQTEQRGLSVDLSVGLSVAIVSPAKRLNKSRFRLGCWLWWAHGTIALARSPMLRRNSETEEGRPIVNYRDSVPRRWSRTKTAEPIEMQFGTLSRLGPGTM